LTPPIKLKPGDGLEVFWYDPKEGSKQSKKPLAFGSNVGRLVEIVATNGMLVLRLQFGLDLDDEVMDDQTCINIPVSCVKEIFRIRRGRKVSKSAYTQVVPGTKGGS